MLQKYVSRGHSRLLMLAGNHVAWNEGLVSRHHKDSNGYFGKTLGDYKCLYITVASSTEHTGPEAPSVLDMQLMANVF